MDEEPEHFPAYGRDVPIAGWTDPPARLFDFFECLISASGNQNLFKTIKNLPPFRYDAGLQIPRLRYSPGLAPTTRLNALLNAASDS